MDLCLLLFSQLFLKVKRSGSRRAGQNGFSHGILLEVILGHSFCNQSQANKGSISSYNIAGLISEVSEEEATHIAKKLPSSTTPLPFDAPAKRNPLKYPHGPYTSRNYSHWPTFLQLIFSQICPVGSKTRTFLHQSAHWPFNVAQGHPRSIILVTIKSAYATSC